MKTGIEARGGGAKAGIVDCTSVEIRDTGVAAGQVLRMISEGYAYDQILRTYSVLSMGDIMAVAELARQVIENLSDEHGNVIIGHQIKFVFSQGKFLSLEKLREKYPRAYVEWTASEDNNLAAMQKRGATIVEIARQHQRQPGAIRARLEKLEFLKRP